VSYPGELLIGQSDCSLQDSESVNVPVSAWSNIQSILEKEWWFIVLLFTWTWPI